MSNFANFFSLFVDSPGDIVIHSVGTVPAGFLECDGAVISRTAYAKLFAAIGTFFGAGNGSTTFQLPDLRGHFLRATDDSAGVDLTAATRTNPAGGVVGDVPGSVILTPAVHSHTHTQQSAYWSTGWGGYALSGVGYQTQVPSSVGGDSRPPNIYVMFCIKI